MREFAGHIVFEEGGIVQTDSANRDPVATSLIHASLVEKGLGGLPERQPVETLHERMSQWLLQTGPSQREEAGLAISVPPSDVHFVPGKYGIYYDFKNTDQVVDALQSAGVALAGRVLDFGCSSGRNLAVLTRAFGPELVLYGVDPAASSIEWAKANVDGVSFDCNHQWPPLPFPDDHFDIIIAKSVWTHFGPEAAVAWFAEMERVLTPGGHLLFSSHGPHDIASRIAHNNPAPRYERFAGNAAWTRDTFLADAIAGLRAAQFYFQPYKEVGRQPDIKQIPDAEIAQWGLAFMLPEFVERALPANMSIVARSIGRTGNRHDLYVVRKAPLVG